MNKNVISFKFDKRSSDHHSKKIVAARLAGCSLFCANLNYILNEEYLDLQKFDNSHKFLEQLNLDYPITSKEMLEWKMGFCVVGELAVNTIFEASIAPFRLDNSTWLELAEEYCSNFYEGIYYSNPNSTHQAQLNNNILKDMREKQKAGISKFIYRNRDLLFEYTNKLYEQNSLYSHEIASLLAGVDVSKEFLVVPNEEPDPYREGYPYGTLKTYIYLCQYEHKEHPESLYKCVLAKTLEEAKSYALDDPILEGSDGYCMTVISPLIDVIPDVLIENIEKLKDQFYDVGADDAAVYIEKLTGDFRTTQTGCSMVDFHVFEKSHEVSDRILRLEHSPWRFIAFLQTYVTDKEVAG